VRCVTMWTISPRKSRCGAALASLLLAERFQRIQSSSKSTILLQPSAGHMRFMRRVGGRAMRWRRQYNASRELASDMEAVRGAARAAVEATRHVRSELQEHSSHVQRAARATAAVTSQGHAKPLRRSSHSSGERDSLTKPPPMPASVRGKPSVWTSSSRRESVGRGTTEDGSAREERARSDRRQRLMEEKNAQLRDTALRLVSLFLPLFPPV
jgi:hypothetical protein